MQWDPQRVRVFEISLVPIYFHHPAPSFLSTMIQWQPSAELAPADVYCMKAVGKVGWSAKFSENLSCIWMETYSVSLLIVSGNVGSLITSVREPFSPACYSWHCVKSFEAAFKTSLDEIRSDRNFILMMLPDKVKKKSQTLVACGSCWERSELPGRRCPFELDKSESQGLRASPELWNTVRNGRHSVKTIVALERVHFLVIMNRGGGGLQQQRTLSMYILCHVTDTRTPRTHTHHPGCSHSFPQLTFI